MSGTGRRWQIRFVNRPGLKHFDRIENRFAQSPSRLRHPTDSHNALARIRANS